MAKSMAGPGWPEVENGGYSVQPPPGPQPPAGPGINSEINSKSKDGGRSQKEMLFMRGNAMSGAPIISGTIQLAKPPIMAGMTMKKIMTRACTEVNTLNICLPASRAASPSTP